MDNCVVTFEHPYEEDKRADKRTDKRADKETKSIVIHWWYTFIHSIWKQNHIK